MQLVLLVGIQASGKSSFFKERFADTHVRINLDMLKTRHREAILFEACLRAKQPVVVDNTNVSRMGRARYLEPARAEKFECIGYYFASSVRSSIARNQMREGKARIPERGIRAASAQLEIPSLSEGFDELFYARLGETFEVSAWEGP